MTSELAAVLQFVEKIEHDQVGKSPYELANLLRGYTKPSYTTLMWSTATGYKQDYIAGEFQGKLNQTVLLSDEATDFGHLIAALADQINQPGVRWSDLTSWTADHTSWAGDIGSAIATFYEQRDKYQLKTIFDALNRFASDSDHAANIAAYLIGAMINTGEFASISKAIAHYDQQFYPNHVRTFIFKRFGGKITTNQLHNPREVEAEIRRAVSTYIRLSPDSGVFKSIKNLLELKPRMEEENLKQPSGVDLLQGSLHFMTYLTRKGQLDPLQFKPARLPKVPWLGSVGYDVKLPLA